MSAELRAVKTSAEQALVDAYAAVKPSLPGDGKVVALREAAFRRFDAAGLPHRRIEEWKYTDLRALIREAKPLAGTPDAAAKARAAEIAEKTAILQATQETMDQALAEMATLGLPIHITELDVNSAQGGQRGFGANVADNAATTQGGLVAEADQKLADAYAGIFRAFLKHRDSVKLVTFWGVNDAVSWRAQGKPLLFDGNNQPKAAFHAVTATAGKMASP